MSNLPRSECAGPFYSCTSLVCNRVRCNVLPLSDTLEVTHVVDQEAKIAHEEATPSIITHVLFHCSCTAPDSLQQYFYNEHDLVPRIMGADNKVFFRAVPDAAEVCLWQ